MHSHFLYMVSFAFLCSIVITLITKESARDQWLYFWKFFSSLVVIALLIAWFMYFFPLR